MLLSTLDRNLAHMLFLDCLVELEGLAFALPDFAYFKFSLVKIKSVAFHEQAHSFDTGVNQFLIAGAWLRRFPSVQRRLFFLGLEWVHGGH